VSHEGDLVPAGRGARGTDVGGGLGQLGAQLILEMVDHVVPEREVSILINLTGDVIDTHPEYYLIRTP
jgi:hypothetical protein